METVTVLKVGKESQQNVTECENSYELLADQMHNCKSVPSELSVHYHSLISTISFPLKEKALMH